MATSRVRRRARRALPILFGVIAAGTALALAGCTPTPSPKDLSSQLTPAIEKADLGFTEVSVGTRLDGVAKYVSVILAVDGDQVTADQLRGALKVSLDTVGGTGYYGIDLAVYSDGSQANGTLLPLWPTLTDVGFTQRASETDTEFSEKMSDIRSVLAQH